MYDSEIARLEVAYDNARFSADGIKAAAPLTRASYDLLVAYKRRNDIQLKQIEKLKTQLNRPLWRRILNV